jgi:hypothetical protein
MTPPITAQTRFNCNVKSGPRGSTASQAATVGLCWGIVIYGITVGEPDLNNGCRWLTANAAFQRGDIVSWYKGPRGDTSHEVVATGGNLLVCPADAGTYWFRLTRSTCSSDSPAVTVP